MEKEMVGGDHGWGEVVDPVAVAGEDERLAPAGEHGAVGIVGAHGSAPDRFQLETTRPESEQTGLAQLGEAPRGFHA
jgi:hypothetical protein